MNATLLDAKKGIVQIAIDELAQRLPADGFFWLDIDGASAEELKTIASALRVDDDTKAGCHALGSEPQPVSIWRSNESAFPLGRLKIRDG